MAQFNVNYFDKIDTEQKAYILGFLQSDGTFSVKGRVKGYYRYKLAIQENDEHIIEYIKKEMNHTGKTITQKRKLKHHQNIKEISLNGIKFTEQLKQIFGGYLKEDRINFPVLPPELVRHYLRGVVDADGSIGDYQGVMLRIEGKKHFLQSIKGITGYNVYINKGNGNSTYTLRANSEEAINFIEWLYGYLDEDSLYLHRKFDIAQEILRNNGVHLREAV